MASEEEFDQCTICGGDINDPKHIPHGPPLLSITEIVKPAVEYLSNQLKFMKHG